jgi:hypothetical protein
MYDKIEGGLIKAPNDFARLLNSRETRGRFLRSVVERADGLRKEYVSAVEAEIEKMRERLHVNETPEPGRSSVLTNSRLASQLSELAKPEVFRFFKALDQFTSFDNEEVRLLSCAS